jgi:serine/threonine protein phosphatase PrpC
LPNPLLGLEAALGFEDESEEFNWDEAAGGSCCVGSCFAVAHIGPGTPPIKNENQDVAVCVDDFTGRAGMKLLGIFDGHGKQGKKAAEYNLSLIFSLHQNPLREFTLCVRYCASRMKEKLAGLINLGQTPKDSLEQAFTSIHSEFSSGTAQMDAQFSGTTATVALIVGSSIWVAWAGDSSCVIVSSHDAARVGEDHRPDLERESKRILAAGGRIKPSNHGGPVRVWHSVQEVPGIMVSRSIGDVFAHGFGVSALPDLYRKQVDPSDRFIILASDGLWDVYSPKDIRDHIQLDETGDSAIIANSLLDGALQRWLLPSAPGGGELGDNISLVVGKLVAPR